MRLPSNCKHAAQSLARNLLVMLAKTITVDREIFAVNKLSQVDWVAKTKRAKYFV